MKGDLKTAFVTACKSIFHKPERPARIHQGNQILIDILRDSNKGSSKFNPEALEAHGINPRSFRKVLAFTYAYATLQWHDRNSPFEDVLIKRCNTCLDMDSEGEYSFGRLLSQKTKTQIEEKLARNTHTAPSLSA